MVFILIKQHTLASIGCLFYLFFLQVSGFDNSRSDNLAVYYGQNSYGATHSDTANWQKTLSVYCQDNTINAIPLAFLHVFFSAGGLPEIDLAGTCNSNGGNVFPGTRLARCPSLAADIKTCQARGKIVTISLGGATGLAGFTSDAQAQMFADTVWNLFLGGASSTRPFGDAILDGVDLDIEGGSGKGLAAFVTRIRSHASGANKKYYITAAPQCPFPDAYLGSVISAVGFDAIYVQYNNYCGVNNYNNPFAWNFDAWDNWAKTTSPNKNIKVYIGAPASPSAAGSGYVDVATLGKIAKETRAKFSSFGGIMLWDASQAYANGRYDVAIKNAIIGGTAIDPPDDECAPEATPTKPTTVPSTKTSIIPTTRTSSTNTSTTLAINASTIFKMTTTTTMTVSTGSTIKTTAVPTLAGTGRCAGINAWAAGSIYVNSNKVTYGGHLWTAKWWSLGDTPRGGVDVWTDNGVCLDASMPTGTGTPSTNPGSAKNCDGVDVWISSTTYVGGNKVTHSGRIWTAKWWSQADTPGGK
ncbi:glycoside hydrolase superfamily [Collybia nuda]|uniref:chitinase n=1 Tax=Collybia nuda TaxID=64659 RepID=A0A9P5YA83_9AGAR|nr:glycoside hydrolase superfamily [Collybia nuda]